MAIIKLSQLVSDIRGKVGGNVFARNKGGNYVRTYVKPINPASPGQATARALFQNIVQQWRTLTDTQRANWAAATSSFPYQDRLGNTKIYSGEQLFIKLNLNLASSGAAFKTGAPVAQTVAIPGLTGITTLSTMSIVLTFTEALTPANTAYIVLATPGLSAGISAPAATKFRIIQVVVGGADPSADLISEYTTKIGIPLVGQKIFFMVRNIDQTAGQASVNVVASKIVA